MCAHEAPPPSHRPAPGRHRRRGRRDRGRPGVHHRGGRLARRTGATGRARRAAALSVGVLRRSRDARRPPAAAVGGRGPHRRRPPHRRDRGTARAGLADAAHQPGRRRGHPLRRAGAGGEAAPAVRAVLRAGPRLQQLLRGWCEGRGRLPEMDSGGRGRVERGGRHRRPRTGRRAARDIRVRPRRGPGRAVDRRRLRPEGGRAGDRVPRRRQPRLRHRHRRPRRRAEAQRRRAGRRLRPQRGQLLPHPRGRDLRTCGVGGGRGQAVRGGHQPQRQRPTRRQHRQRRPVVLQSARPCAGRGAHHDDG